MTTLQIITFIIGLIAAMATVAFWVHKAARLRCIHCGGDGLNIYTKRNCHSCNGTGEQQ